MAKIALEYLRTFLLLPPVLCLTVAVILIFISTILGFWGQPNDKREEEK